MTFYGAKRGKKNYVTWKTSFQREGVFMSYIVVNLSKKIILVCRVQEEVALLWLSKISSYKKPVKSCGERLQLSAQCKCSHVISPKSVAEKTKFNNFLSPPTAKPLNPPHPKFCMIYVIYYLKINIARTFCRFSVVYFLFRNQFSFKCGWGERFTLESIRSFHFPAECSFFGFFRGKKKYFLI